MKSMNPLKNQIHIAMQAKETEEFTSIWQDNDRGQWSDEAFLVIHDLLIERTGQLPPQKKPKNEPKDLLPKQPAWKKELEFWLFVGFLIGVLLLICYDEKGVDTWLAQILPVSIQNLLPLVLPLLFLCYGLWSLWQNWRQKDKRFSRWVISGMLVLFGGFETESLFHQIVSMEIQNLQKNLGINVFVLIWIGVELMHRLFFTPRK